jgi:beta-lactamase superfamily II metal-dependent hydrolase
VKVGHHGLRGDMPASFLELLPPIDVAIYTNHEQWVDETVWKNITNHGARQYITSVFGGIAAVFDGEDVRIFAINEDPYTEDGFYGRLPVTL